MAIFRRLRARNGITALIMKILSLGVKYLNTMSNLKPRSKRCIK